MYGRRLRWLLEIVQRCRFRLGYFGIRLALAPLSVIFLTLEWFYVQLRIECANNTYGAPSCNLCPVRRI